jgi:PAS domain-containing protein
MTPSPTAPPRLATPRPPGWLTVRAASSSPCRTPPRCARGWRAALGIRAVPERANDALLRAFLARMPGVIYRSAWDRGYAVELISDEIERVVGYPASDFVDRGRLTLLSVMHPDDREPIMARASLATDGQPFVSEYRLIHRDARCGGWPTAVSSCVARRTACGWTACCST